jgi:hypothetical protein
MGSRPLMVATLLGASVGVPYVMSQTSQGSKAAPSSAVSPYAGSPAVPGLLSPQNQFATAKGGSPIAGGAPPIEGVRFHSLGEVLRFDVTKEWVYSNWPRKSTGLADPELYGVRVPLVTGIGLSDLAGSLTYSFNRENQVQHISFLGRTADTTQLIQFLTTTYKLERRDALAGEQLYQVGSDDRVQSELRTRPDPVLWSTSPHGSFAVALELERPGSDRYLPPLVAKLPTPPTPAPTPPAAAGNPANPAAPAGQAAISGDQSSWWDSLRQSTYDKVRHATPAEDNQVQWKRWPN